MSSITQALSDVTEAQALGLDAFALNVQQPSADWTANSLALLFNASAQTGFKLFFSMDMSAIPSPSTCLPLLTQYAHHPAYYTHLNRPFLMTFHGGTDSNAPAQWQTTLQSLSPRPFFAPNLDDHPSTQGGVFASSIFTTFPAADGLTGWETAWSFPGPVPSTTTSSPSPRDAANLAATSQNKKTYIMPLSTFQSKHAPQWGNWYRRGELTLTQQMIAILSLQPDFVQILTWNDAGEGHYIGNLWPEAITDDATRAVIGGYDHAAWRAVLGPFVQALKKGAKTPGEVVPAATTKGGKVAGAFWYRPLLKTAQCESDRFGLGKPDNWDDAEDVVSVVVLVPEGRGSRWTVRVWNGGSVVGSSGLAVGLNAVKVAVKNGDVKVDVVDGSQKVVGTGKGAVNVTDQIADLVGVCNFNYQVVEIA